MRFVGPRAGAADDYVFMPLQGSTQWDGLSHMFLDGVMYNGFWMGNVDALHGARRGSIDTFKSSFVGRGVLLDVARHLGVDRLPKGHAITPEELDATAAAQAVEVRAGDILLVRTGHVPYFYHLADKTEFWKDGAPGLGNACLDWIADHDIAALAMDNVAITVQPTEPPVSIHTLLLVDLGLPLGEIWWLDDLAAACAAENRYEFFLAAPPLNVSRSAGAPLNPVAIL
jgi:kynurenine formamidase